MAKQYGIKNESYWEHWGTFWEPLVNLMGTYFENFPLPLPRTLEIKEKKIKPSQTF